VHAVKSVLMPMTRVAGRGQLGVHHAVRVLADRRAEFGAVADPDDQRPPG
jgi:hypothetical protein